MALEDQIAQLVETGGNINEGVLAWIANVGKAGTDAIADLNTAYADILANGGEGFYVDQANGNDGALGDLANPLASIDEALSRIPSGGYVTCLLMGDYNFTAELRLSRQHLFLRSDSTTRHLLTFDRYTTSAGVLDYRELHGFSCIGNSSIAFRDLEIQMPVADGGFAAANENRRSCIIRGNATMFDTVHVHLMNCNLTWPTAPFGDLISIYNTAILGTRAVVETGAPMDGNWFSGVSASTDPATEPGILTNLASL